MATTLTTSLEDVLRDLHQRRSEKAALDAALAEKRALFNAENAALLTAQKDAQAAIETAEDTARQLAAAHYRATKEKQPAPGVTIKLFKTMAYDEADAFRFAKQSGLALIPESLDRKAFEKIASATTLAFVRYDEEPRVTIATDLSKHLPERAAAPEPVAAATVDEDPFA